MCECDGLSNSFAHRVSRVCIQATEVCGVEIPKGMNILVPVHYLHSLKRVWGDPEVFRPER